MEAAFSVRWLQAVYNVHPYLLGELDRARGQEVKGKENPTEGFLPRQGT